MNFIDKAITYVSPKWGAERAAYRAQGQIMASYSGAVPTRTATPWTASQQPQSRWALPYYDRMRMVDRARQLDRDNPIANGMLTRATENVIGEGFQLQCNSADPEWNKQAEALFDGWFPTADVNGLTWV